MSNGLLLACLYLLEQLLVLLVVEAGLLNELLDFLRGQSVFVVHDRDIGLVVLVFVVDRFQVEHSIGVYFDFNCYFRLALLLWFDSLNLELPQLVIVLGQFSFSLENWEPNYCLIITACRVLLLLDNWNGGVPRNNH